ncbi:SDR family oxidoreductase [Sporosarcina sp. 179-K 3D1 HS]|uniref:SDR family oxidoreductase n=1 Tax=Sporosarcina sp. 179-K 3D1 HS TaxID=3232169 RepID=UPI00399FE48F
MTIFLTGSTGFLGGKLLERLIETTDHPLVILVRDMEKAERLLDTLPVGAEQRVTLVRGDITDPLCGMDSSIVNELQGTVDLFYHIAALVKFDEELRDDLFRINYDGTRHAVDLAKQLGVKRFHYISTAYTIGKRTRGIEQLYPVDSNVHNPYEESKVKAEHLVFSHSGPMEVSIFRPSIIVGDSETGEADSEFTLYGFMRALDVFKRRRGKSISLKESYRLIGSKEATSNLVPVNYVADILAIAAEKAQNGKIYNITNPAPPSNHLILNLIKKAIGFEQLEIIEDADINTLTEDEIKLNSLVAVFNAYLSRSFHFEDENTQRLIAGTSTHHLHMPLSNLEMIIDSYFQLKHPQTIG